MRRCFLSFVVAGSLTLTGSSFAQPSLPVEEAEMLEEVVVEEDYDRRLTGPFLPDIEGTRILAGKKSSNILPDELPEINSANYRQVIARTPGLILAEQSNPLVSIGARGYNPGNTQSFQVLEDGIPIQAAMFGEPYVYYTPPLDAVDRIEVIRGGAALMYGPQPAGAINFVMKKPPLNTKFTLESTNTVGSFNYYSNFTSLGGTMGRFGYYGWYNHRETDGFREANSDYFLNAYSFAFALDASGPRRLYLELTAYDEVHGEPGGLALSDAPNAVNYTKNRNATVRFFDRMRVSRYAAALIYESDVSEDTLFTFRGWWDYNLRYSRRQRGGGFGILPSGPVARTNDIQTQQYYTFGIEPRLRHDWELFNQTQTLTGGAMLYNTYSPSTGSRGDSPTAMQGPIYNQSYRYNWYFSAFAENKFQLGNLSIVPGVRLENIWQSVNETVNVAKTRGRQPLANEMQYNFVPLFGLGLEYAFTPKIAAYVNVSQAYRPIFFSQGVPSTPNSIVEGNLEESFIWNYEFGFRGDPKSWIFWDTSFFMIDNSNQIGARTTERGNLTIIENSGHSFVYGWDLAAQVDLIGFADSLFNHPVTHENASDKNRKFLKIAPKSWSETYGSLSIYNALTLAKGEFIEGPNKGNTPQYLPTYLYRCGLIYNWQNRIKVAFMGNFVGSSFANDNNTPSWLIPAYDVWDLSIEAKVYKDYVSIVGGVNNVFNRNYYSRIHYDGVSPAMPQNWYVGVKVVF